MKKTSPKTVLAKPWNWPFGVRSPEEMKVIEAEVRKRAAAEKKKSITQAEPASF